MEHYVPCGAPALCSVPAPLSRLQSVWQVERAGTHLVPGQDFQVLQDLSHHHLAELAVLSQELGVSPVQAVIGVNWLNKQGQHVTWDWQMAGRPGRECGNAKVTHWL